VQVYLKFPNSSGAPIRALRGFARVRVPAGQKQHVHLSLAPRDLSQVNETGDRLIASGEYRVSVGEDSLAQAQRQSRACFRFRESKNCRSKIGLFYTDFTLARN